MGKGGNGVCEVLPVDVSMLPEPLKDQVSDFLTNFHHRYGLDCAILYGSRATGMYHSDSDIDLVLISKNVSEDFWKRLKSVSELLVPRVPLEPLVYTPAEFHCMIENMHVTALDAVTQGIVLAGNNEFVQFKDHLTLLEMRGLRRSKNSWVMDRSRNE